MGLCMMSLRTWKSILVATSLLSNWGAKMHPVRSLKPVRVLFAALLTLSHHSIVISGHPLNTISNAVNANQVVRIGVLASGAIQSSLVPTIDAAHSTFARQRSRSAQEGARRVAELRVFPIKSCGAGAALDKLVIGDVGPQHDRCLMVCQKPHWNRDALSNSWVWQDTWGAVTPRTPKENPATKQMIDGASLLLVRVAVNPDATMTISSNNAARHMPELRIAVQPPADAPLIDNVPSRFPSAHHPLIPGPLPQVTRWDSHDLKAYEIEDASKWFAECAASMIRGPQIISTHVLTLFACISKCLQSKYSAFSVPLIVSPPGVAPSPSPHPTRLRKIRLRLSVAGIRG